MCSRLRYGFIWGNCNPAFFKYHDLSWRTQNTLTHNALSGLCPHYFGDSGLKRTPLQLKRAHTHGHSKGERAVSTSSDTVVVSQSLRLAVRHARLVDVLKKGYGVLD